MLVASIAQGSSASADWTPVGVHAQRLPDILKVLRSQRLDVDAVVWHQGQIEAWLSGDGAVYTANLRRWIASVRAHGINDPFMTALLPAMLAEC